MAVDLRPTAAKPLPRVLGSLRPLQTPPTPFPSRTSPPCPPQIVAGLDEGLLSMSTGGVRRLYIPGELAFPKGLPAAAGRPRVPPSSPVVFDVALRYIPGITDEDEE